MSKVQSTIFGDTEHEDVVEIDTNGRIARPLLEIPNALVYEFKLQVEDDGLHATAVDPANVGAVEFHVSPDAFDAFTVQQEATLGVELDTLRARCKRARMRKNGPDPLTLDLDERRALVTTEREYTDTTVRQTDQINLIDPDVIRKEPDVPQMSLAYEAAVDVRAFTDTIENLESAGDGIAVAEDGGRLTLSVDGDEKAVADFGHIAEAVDDDAEPDATSVLTSDYLADIAGGLKKAKVDDITIRWGQEFPVMIDFERTLEDDDGQESVAYSGTYMIAPRLEGGNS